MKCFAACGPTATVTVRESERDACSEFWDLGFCSGMQHALEADHIAAVSSIAARRTDVGDIVKHGLTWGLGHTLTLFVFAGAAILLGHAIPEHLARPLETAVGIMLVGLGAHVLWRLWRDRVHFHSHGHGDGTVHLHAHSHAGETDRRTPARRMRMRMAFAGARCWSD